MSDNSNQSGSKPPRSTNDFTAARDGKQQEYKSPVTDAQKRATEAHLKKSKDASVNPIEKKSAEANFQFNAQSVGPKQTKSTVEPKKPAPQPYKSKATGKVYTSAAAKAAAKQLDKQELSKTDVQKQTEIKKHHAPAPKPRGTKADQTRGVAVVPAKSEQASKTPEEARAAHANRVAAQYQADKARGQGQAKTVDKDLGR